MKPLLTLLSLATLAGLVVTAAPAEVKAESTRIIGIYRQTTIVDTVVNRARGRNARAGVSIGTVHGGETVFGSHNSTIKVGRVVNEAGRKEKSCIHIGTYGKNPVC